MPELLLIQPRLPYQRQSEALVPPLNLAYIAACTPENWDIKIIDESVEEIDFSANPDLIGITAYTRHINRAYEIASRFKAKGGCVVMGGIHVTLRPDEALKQVDSVVLGDGESVWPEVIKDFESKRLKQKYTGRQIPLSELPIPRRDLLSDRYACDSIITSRGCPFHCEFCCIHSFNDSKYRQRPINSVLDEFETLKRGLVFVVDDNILGCTSEHQNRACELFQGLINRKINKKWVTQVSLNFAENDKLMSLAFKSGCRAVIIGIESFNQDNLKQMKKSLNLKSGFEGVRKAVSRIHGHGMAVIGVFILGNDYDTPDHYAGLKTMLKKVRLDSAEFQYLTPYPGTRLHERLQREQRLIYTDYPKDWEKCEESILFRPNRLSIPEIVRYNDYFIRHRFSRLAIAANTVRTLVNTRSLSTAIFSAIYNISGRKDYMENLHYNRYGIKL